MSFSLDEIKGAIFYTFRRVALAIFVAIIIYTPIPTLLTVEESVSSRYYIIFNSIASILALLFIYYSPRMKFSISIKIPMVSFVFLLGIIFVTLSSFHKNPILISFLMIGLVPAVLVHSRIPCIIYNLLITITYLLTVFSSGTEIRTANAGLVKIEKLAVSTKLTTLFVLLLGLLNTYFIRKSII